ncbi:hypothetical protein BV898_12422 [Hypsibius exemplaris]|uniref:LIM and calponin-like proteiny domains-containing protein 1 n=1 Tax=Hypsibius exemplaris TaxID=2072580 RepID=A0A1W0WDN0_HYPEX|nr:hypothetical protein BV898_12422 [Hypsibius exemplaris]
MDYLALDQHFVALQEEELEFLVDLAVNESQRWIEAVTRSKFRAADFVESLEDGVLLCELVERIWPRYIRLDEGGGADDSFTRLYGQRTLESFRAAAEKIGIEESFIFQHQHIQASERYSCSPDAQDAIQETLIRVTATIYLLGWRAKETPTYGGPQLDLSAFPQLFQHYLRHFHNNFQTLCSKGADGTDSCLPREDSLTSPVSELRQDSLEDEEEEDVNADSLDDEGNSVVAESEQKEQTELVVRNSEEMPSQEMEDTFGLRSGVDGGSGSPQDGLHHRSGYYADSVGSSGDSACGSTSPSVAEHPHGRTRSGDGLQNDEFVKTKDLQSVGGGGGADSSVAHHGLNRKSSTEIETVKQKLKEDEIEWETNLSNWKSKRKSNLSSFDHGDSEEHNELKSSPERNLRTFPTMIADRIQRHIPALYSDDDNVYQASDNTREEEEPITGSSNNKPLITQDNSEKDSSSGVSSPRSSRSLTSVSPPPSSSALSPTRKPQQQQHDDEEFATTAMMIPPPENCTSTVTTVRPSDPGTAVPSSVRPSDAGMTVRPSDAGTEVRPSDGLTTVRPLDGSTTTPPTKKVISLTRMGSGDGSVNDWKVLASPAASSDEEGKGSSLRGGGSVIETSVKPFGEKLAMFEKAQTDPTVLDMNKCNYKELAKPELSLRDKLSHFEREAAAAAPTASSAVFPPPDSIAKDSRTPVTAATAATFKSTSRAFQQADPVPHHLPPPPPPQPPASTGMGRLLSKDLLLHAGNIRTTAGPSPPLVSELENDAVYMAEIDGILGGNTPVMTGSGGGVVLTLQTDRQPARGEEEEDYFPPPPLPSNPPPPPVAGLPAASGLFQVDDDDDDQQYGRDIKFPTPPPGMMVTGGDVDHEEAEEDSDSSRKSSLTSNESQDPPLRRKDSTKRIKSELLKRRSDFFGIRHDTPEANPQPDSPPSKPRPQSLHELYKSKPTPAVVTSKPSSPPTSPSKSSPTSPNKAALPIPKGVPITKELKITLDRRESDDIEREQRHIVDSLELEEERWRKKDQRPTRTKESVIASIVEEYRRELVKEKEAIIHTTRKEMDRSEGDLPVRKDASLQREQQQQGILKRPIVATEKVAKVGSVPPPSRMVDVLPVTVLDSTKKESRTVTKSEENKGRVVIVEKFEKVTEERRVNGRFETSSTEEKRSVDRLNDHHIPKVSPIPPAMPAFPTTKASTNQPRIIQHESRTPFTTTNSNTATQEQHYRDPSNDGGYSSGRSDQSANNVRSWLQHPSNNLPVSPLTHRDNLGIDTRDLHRDDVISLENLPPRPPMPTEFRPPVYTTPNRQEPASTAVVYQPQYTSKPAPVTSARMQQKQEASKQRSAVSAVDVQKHWLVQEAEMRRLNDTEARLRAAAVPPPLPNRTVLLPASQMYTGPAGYAGGEAPGYQYQQHGSLGRSQQTAGPAYQPVKSVEQYSTVIRNAPQHSDEDRYAPQDQIRQVMRTVGPISHPPQPIVHRPNHPPYVQPVVTRQQQPEALPSKYPTAHNPAHLSSPTQHSKPNYYPPGAMASQSVPNISQVRQQPQQQQQPKPFMTHQMTNPPAFDQGLVPNQSMNSISAKWPCQHCGQCLGREPAMIVENLSLVYHVACFKCVVCGQRLSDGREGADVRVRNGKLHCNSCLSDDGMQLSEL